MIFVAVGTILPFDRLVRAVDSWGRYRERSDIFGQIGVLNSDNYRPNFPWSERLSPLEFRSKIESADLVVSHAGIGTMLETLTRGTPILIMPRRYSMREHVSDHQVETVRKFADRPGVTVANEPEDVGRELDHLLEGGACGFSPPSASADDRLILAIRQAIFL